MKKALLPAFAVLIACISFGQNVGIGISSPAYPLDVAGTTNISGDMYTAGFIGIGTKAPLYKLTVTDGSVALYNTTDLKYWTMSYSSGGNYLYFGEAGSVRMAIANGGNVGIGTITPSAKLDVVGNAEINGTLSVSGTAAVGGSMTVNNNKGVLYNLMGSTNIKYYTRGAGFTISNLGAHALTAEFAIGFIGGFTTAPQVFVGDISGASNTTAYHLQLVVYDVTPTGCKCRLLNTSSSAVSASLSWSILCVGD